MMPSALDGFLIFNLKFTEKFCNFAVEVHFCSLFHIDSLLAATALHHDMVLVTRNLKNFDIPGLELLNPWEL